MPPEPFDSLSDPQLRYVDAACEELENALGSGETSPIEMLVERAAEQIRPTLLRELIEVELEVRSQSGEQPSETEYAERFSADSETVKSAFANFLASEAGSASHAAEFADNSPLSQTGPRGETPSPVKGGDASLSRLSREELPREFGRYTLTSLLGRGGMGAVFLAHDRQLDRQVALKIPDFSHDEARRDELVERFYREARSMATLHHPGLCPVFDVGDIDGVHYLTMPYLQGQTLRELLKEGNSYPPGRVAAVLLKLALAVEAAHRVGVIHRDLKPANIMVDQNHEPVIMDFGLAQRQHDGESTITRSGDVFGTPHYMSPEQMRGRAAEVGPATDVYSLGVIGYELLTGRRPFTGSVGEIAAGILTREPDPPSSVRRTVDDSIEAICLKAMAKAVEDRFSSAAAMAAVLHAYIHRSLHPDDSVPSTDQLVSSPDSTELTLARDFLMGLQNARRQAGDRQSTHKDATQLLTNLDTLQLDDVSSAQRPSQRKMLVGVVLLSCVLVAGLRPDWIGLGDSIPDDSSGSIGSAASLETATISTNRATIESKKNVEDKDSIVAQVPIQKTVVETWTPLQPVAFTNWNPRWMSGPQIADNGLTILFSCPVPDDGPIRLRLFQASRSSLNDPFDQPRQIDLPLPHENCHVTDPSLSADGLLLAFCSNLQDGSVGNHDIWLATRTSRNAKWSAPINAGLEANSEVNEYEPALSADGLTLIFHSDRPGSNGDTDLWVSQREIRDAPFGPARNAGSGVNGPGNEGGAFLSADGLTFFFHRHDGSSHSLWHSRRQSVDEPFEESTRIDLDGAIVPECPTLRVDGRILYLAARPAPDSELPILWQTSLQTSVVAPGSCNGRRVAEEPVALD